MSDGSSSKSPCTTDADCPRDWRCLYRVGACSAPAECVDPSSLGFQCLHVVSYCGCDGSSVPGLCGPPFALGPTLGSDAPCSPPAKVARSETVTTLASMPTGRMGQLAVDSTSAYFTAHGATGGLVLKVPTTGGNVVTLASGPYYPSGVAVDASRVYWMTLGGEIMSAPLGGGTPTTLAAGQAPVGRIAIDASTLYWTNEPGAGGFSILKLPATGGTPAVVAAPQDRWGLTVAARGGTVYWSRRDTVVSQPASGGPVVTLASGQRSATNLVVDASNVYWTSSRPGAGPPSMEIIQVPIRGGTPTTLATRTWVAGLATDGSNLYFTEPGMVNDGAIVRLPVGGGSPTTLVTGQAGPGPIVADASSVYWLDMGIGALMKISPK